MTKKKDIAVEIGQRVIAVRKQMRLHQKEMAADLNISASYLCEIESGRAKPNIELLIKMVSLYNINLNYLVMGTGKMLLDGGQQMENESYDIDDGIESMEELIWFMENSKFFRTTIMSLANKTIISEREIIKKSWQKPASQQSQQKTQK
jgi:transcriptional regulator with XRE-family HTH domain